MKNSVFFVGGRNKKIEKKAQKLGFRKVYFVKLALRGSDIKNDTKNYDVILIKTKNLSELRRFIDKAYKKFEHIFILGTIDKINRIALENKKTKALVSPEYQRKNDFLHYRNSGLNHVLCKIAYNNNKIIIENFNSFSGVDEVQQALILGRMIQNARICKKYKTEFTLGNFINNNEEIISKSDLTAFERILF